MPKFKPSSSGPTVKVGGVPSSKADHFDDHDVDAGLSEFVQAVAKNEPDTVEIIRIAILLAQRNPSKAVLRKIRDLIPGGEPLPPAKTTDTRGDVQTVAGIQATPIERANRQGYRLELHNPTDKKMTMDVAFDNCRNLELAANQPPPVKHGSPSSKFAIPSDVPISRNTTVIHCTIEPGATHYAELEPIRSDEPQHLEFVMTETAQIIERPLASGIILKQTNHPQASGYTFSCANTTGKNYEVALDLGASVNLQYSTDTPSDTTFDKKALKATFFAPAGMESTAVVTVGIKDLKEDIALKMKVGLKEKKEKPKPKPKPESDSDSDDSLPPMALAIMKQREEEERKKKEEEERRRRDAERDRERERERQDREDDERRRREDDDRRRREDDERRRREREREEEDEREREWEREKERKRKQREREEAEEKEREREWEREKEAKRAKEEASRRAKAAEEEEKKKRRRSASKDRKALVPPPPPAPSTSKGKDLRSGMAKGADIVDKDSDTDNDHDVNFTTRDTVPNEGRWGEKDVVCNAIVQPQDLGTKDGWKLHMENPTNAPLRLDVDFTGSDNLTLPRNQMVGIAVEDLAVVRSGNDERERWPGYQASVTLQPGEKKVFKLDPIRRGERQHISYIISDSASVTTAKLNSGIILHTCGFPQGGGFGFALENPTDSDITITLDITKSDNLRIDPNIPDGTELVDGGTAAKRRINAGKGPEMFFSAIPVDVGEPVFLRYSARTSFHKGGGGKAVKGPKASGANATKDVAGQTATLCKLNVTPILLADAQGYKVRLVNPTDAPVSVDADFSKSKGLALKADGVGVVRARTGTADVATPLACVVSVPAGKTVDVPLIPARSGADIDLDFELLDTAPVQARALDSGGVLHLASLAGGTGFALGLQNNSPETLKFQFDFSKCENVLLHRSPSTPATVDISTLEAVLELPPKAPLTAFVTLFAQSSGKAKLAYTMKQFVNGKPFKKKA